MTKFLLYVAIIFAATIAAAYGQQVSGKVVSLDGEGIGGVNILLKGTPQGTATNMNGRFSFELPEGDDVLIFSMLKHKAVEQAFSVRKGFQYHITVSLSRKNQTFNKSDLVVDELPVDCRVIEGTVSDLSGRALPGASIRQERNSFSAESDMKGRFRLPVPDGANTLLISLPGFKSLYVPFDIAKEDISVNVTLATDNASSRAMKSIAEVAPAN
jgi:hypothetical protein